MTPQTTFKLALAIKLAALAARSYREFTLADVRTDTQVLVVEEPDAVYVAFRGTSSLRDWITDARFLRRTLVQNTWGNCEVHSGFLNASGSIIEPLIHHLHSIAAGRPVYVTGHSLGGALAVLGAFEMRCQGLSVAAVYTFGQPRVGNKSFARCYNSMLGYCTFAVVNECDPVPLLPGLLLGYRDCGNEVFLPRTGDPQINPFIGAVLFSDLLGSIKSWRQSELAWLPNHYIGTYQNTLAAQAVLAARAAVAAVPQP